MEMWSLIEDVVATEVEDEDGVKMCMFTVQYTLHCCYQLYSAKTEPVLGFLKIICLSELPGRPQESYISTFQSPGHRTKNFY